jgi:hypothetical protein
MVDNSQGHSSYGIYALLTARMNLRPGGKQAQLCDGWFIKNGERVIQPMNFPPGYSEFPDMPKGMRQVLVERGLWKEKLHMKCKDCNVKATACCATRIWISNLTLKSNGHWSKKSLKLQGTYASFCPSSTAN